MIVRKHGFILDVDMEETARYSRTHSLCDCNEDRNLYAQARETFPKLTELLAQVGLLIDRPDETGSVAMDGYIDYLFVSYTVIGEILESDKYELELSDGGLTLKVVIDYSYIPNEQKTKRLFTVTVYNIDLPWVLNEPFPAYDAPVRASAFFRRIKEYFRKK